VEKKKTESTWVTLKKTSKEILKYFELHKNESTT
jgi:hypothetical protein